MARAYILIEMVAGQSRSLVNSLRGHKGVRDVARVTGPYDVIVEIEGQDIEEISNIIAEDIHTLEGLVRTTTCVSLD